MTQSSSSACAPCIVGSGIIVNRANIHRLLCDLGQVRYFDIVDGSVVTDGTGYIMEVFSDPQCATVAIGRTLYVNVCSFDYLQLHTDLEQQVTFDLVQDNRTLRLMPISTSMDSERLSSQDAHALEAAVAEVLAASFDAHADNCNDWVELDKQDRSSEGRL
ncbi:MAG: hypothetical protein AAF974_05120 [Cyanobacteria bacterium P01_E01_bin.34]